MSDTKVPVDASASAAHPIMFWVLTALALAIFIPCTVVPIGVESDRLRLQEQRLKRENAVLQARYERSRDRAEALASDPLVNERIARRELNYRPEGEDMIQWASDELVSARPEMETLSGQESSTVADVAPLWQKKVTAWLPAWPYRDLFASEPRRTILLLMAGGMLLAAFVLYAPSNQSPTSNKAE